ncbi:hypothetical protein [Nonomuraea sp. NPDC049725]|uniref:hypothetical protein n=1 Tax=Nonomuraea sp. NPDC049725 TaxID=3154508 RepID=UPI003447D618
MAAPWVDGGYNEAVIRHGAKRGIAVQVVKRLPAADGRGSSIEPEWRPVPDVDMMIEPAGAVSRSRQRRAFLRAS